MALGNNQQTLVIKLSDELPDDGEGSGTSGESSEGGSEDDGNTEVFYFKNATATFSSFTEPPKSIKF